MGDFLILTLIKNMDILEAIILGLVQGLTEFLPVSSSGHIALVEAMFSDVKLSADDSLLLTAVLHSATALSTIVIFRNDIFMIIKDLFQFKLNESTLFSLKIILSMIPVGIVGVFFKDEIEIFFQGNVLLVGAMLWITGLLLLFTHYVKPREGEDVTFFRALIIGIVQAVAIIPGISRSGSTIATALLLKADKAKAARFSFLMVLPPILGATLLEIKDYMEVSATQESISVTVLIVGFLTAFLTGIIACKWMIELVKRGKLFYFSIYCFIVGSIAVGVALM